MHQIKPVYWKLIHGHWQISPFGIMISSNKTKVIFNVSLLFCHFLKTKFNKSNPEHRLWKQKQNAWSYCSWNFFDLFRLQNVPSRYVMICRHFYCRPGNWIARYIDQPLESHKVWPNSQSRKCNNGLGGSRLSKCHTIHEMTAIPGPTTKFNQNNLYVFTFYQTIRCTMYSSGILCWNVEKTQGHKAKTGRNVDLCQAVTTFT